MKTYTNAEGWTFDYHHREADLWAIPTEKIAEQNKKQIVLCHIPSSQGVTRRVYFVDVWDRNSWITVAQCKTKDEALKLFNEVEI